MFSGVGRAGRRDALGDLDPVGAEVVALGGVVRDQPQPLDAELEQDLGRRAVLARVDRQAEVQVRVDGVVAAVLQLVGLQLGRDADAAALVAAQVDDDAAAGLVRSRPSRRRAGSRSRSGASRRRRRSGTRCARARAPARPPLGSPRTNARWSTPSICDRHAWQVNVPCRVGTGASATWRMSRSVRRRWRMSSAIADHRQPVRARERLELRTPRHRVPVGGDDLAEHPGGLAPGEPREVDRRLRVPGALEHAARAAAQREDVAGADEVAGDGVRVGERAERPRAVGGRDAGRDARERGRPSP